MSSEIEVEINAGSGGKTYVVEGATLTCSLGTIQNQLQIPKSHNIYIKGIKQANIGDHGGGSNILSFGPCHRSSPPPPCVMATSMKWVGGKENVFVDDEEAILNTSVNFCACGGVVSIVDDGQV
jgi:hypothetical protein